MLQAMARLCVCISIVACVSSSASKPCSVNQGVNAASLLQVGSSMNGQMESYGQQGEATFTEYASNTWRDMNNVVVALAEKVAGHNYTMTASEAKALGTIKGFIRSMINATTTQHLEDQGEVDRARNLIQGCTDDTSASMTVVNGLKASVASSRQRHSSCRTTEVFNKDSVSTACDDYTKYRTTNANRVPPDCLSVKLTSDYIGTSDATKKAQMETCLEEAKTWLDPLHQKYMLCKNSTTIHLNKTAECNLEQGVLEENFCAYESRLEDTCAAQTSCRARTVEARNETHKAVAVAEAARKTDVEGGLRILCLFGVFEANNTNKPGTLSTCLKKTYNTSEYDITYHSIPVAVSCTKEAHEPCDEYESQAWYSKAPATTCKVCPAPAPATPEPTPPPAPTGPASWVWDGDEPKTWDDAVADCRSKGLELVTPHTAEEKDAFFDYAAARRSQITGYEWWRHEWWVGTYKEANCTFYNVDGTDFNPGTWFWLPGEPNSCPRGAADRMCGDTNDFKGQAKSNFGFNDQECSYRHQYFCGQPALATTTTTTAALISKVGSASCTDVTVEGKVYTPCYCYANDGSHYPPSLASLTDACGDATDLVVGGKKCVNSPGESVQLPVGPLKGKFRNYLTEHKIHTDFDAAGKYQWYTEVYGSAQGDREGMGWIMLKDASGQNYWAVSTYYRQIADRAHLNAAWGSHGSQLTSVAGQNVGQPCVGDEYYIWMRE